MEICIFDLDPGNATLNIQITEVNSTIVNISWNPLPVCYQGADGLEYELEVKHLVSKVSNVTLNSYTNTTSYIFMGFSHYEAYELTVIPTNNEGKGVSSKKYFITPQGRKLIVDKVWNDVHIHLGTLIGTVSLRVFPSLTQSFIGSPGRHSLVPMLKPILRQHPISMPPEFFFKLYGNLMISTVIKIEHWVNYI